MTRYPGAALVVAVDGPSGTGKSSVAKALARRLGLSYLDTGAMYRALAWHCLNTGVDLGDHAAVAQAARDLPLNLGTDPAGAVVLVGGTDISEAIRTSAISQVVSQVATNLAVREELVRRQRELVEQLRAAGGVVAEGRDITTVVAPDADVRLLLTATESARLARRARQMHGSASSDLVEQTRDEVIRRDRDDSSVSEFFAAAPGVLLVDSSDLTLEETVATVLALVREHAGRPGSTHEEGS